MSGVADWSWRRGEPADAASLAAFGARTFEATYRHLDDPADIADYVARHFTPVVMQALLADHRNTALLTEIDGELVGYALLAWREVPDCVDLNAAIELSRLYLDQRHIGSGLGAWLIEQAHAEAQRQGAQAVWLGVYDRNERAMRFYRRFGYHQVGTRSFLFGGQLYYDPVYLRMLGEADASQVGQRHHAKP